MTTKEAEIIQQLLADRRIHSYVFVQTVNEGRDLPGSTSMGEIELLSAIIVTADAAYIFWLDWKDDQYVFKHWQEFALNTIRPHALKLKDKILASQLKVREKSKCTH